MKVFAIYNYVDRSDNFAYYNYVDRSGNSANRQIQFSRTGSGPETIQAKVFVLNRGIVGDCLATIPGNQISVEMQNSSQKTNALILEGQDNTSHAFPPEKLSELGILQQRGVLGSLGIRRIEVSNGPVSFGGLKIPSSLRIFDPR